MAEEESTTKFDKFWNAYPRKVSKGAARRAFEKANPQDDELEEWLLALDAQKRWRMQASKLDRRELERLQLHVPPWKHPGTWINQEGWCDQLPSLTMPDFDYPAASHTSQCRSCNRILGYKESAPDQLCCWCWSLENDDPNRWGITQMRAWLREHDLTMQPGESKADYALRCRDRFRIILRTAKAGRPGEKGTLFG